MPDNGSPSPSDFSTLESLISEAEQQATTPVNDHPKPCNHTFNADTDTKCPTCLWSFCVLCASSLDPQYCHLCCSDVNTELIEEPLVDTEGVQHAGRALHPTPVAGATYYSPRLDIDGVTLCKTISQMDMSELEAYIVQYKHLVHQAETILDRRRVVLGTSQLELSERKQSEQRRLRADKTKYPVKTVSLDKSTGKQKVSTASMVQMLEMMRALDAKVKARQQTTQTTQQGVIKPNSETKP